MTMLSRKFSVPASKDKKQWQKVQLLVEQGFKFYAVYELLSDGLYQRVRYPKTLQEARDFVVNYQPNTAYKHSLNPKPDDMDAH